jgi:hypothetical protein
MVASAKPGSATAAWGIKLSVNFTELWAIKTVTGHIVMDLLLHSYDTVTLQLDAQTLPRNHPVMRKRLRPMQAMPIPFSSDGRRVSHCRALLGSANTPLHLNSIGLAILTCFSSCKQFNASETDIELSSRYSILILGGNAQRISSSYILLISCMLQSIL